MHPTRTTRAMGSSARSRPASKNAAARPFRARQARGLFLGLTQAPPESPLEQGRRQDCSFAAPLVIPNSADGSRIELVEQSFRHPHALHRGADALRERLDHELLRMADELLDLVIWNGAIEDDRVPVILIQVVTRKNGRVRRAEHVRPIRVALQAHAGAGARRGVRARTSSRRPCKPPCSARTDTPRQRRASPHRPLDLVVRHRKSLPLRPRLASPSARSVPRQSSPALTSARRASSSAPTTPAWSPRPGRTR